MVNHWWNGETPEITACAEYKGNVVQHISTSYDMASCPDCLSRCVHCYGLLDTCLDEHKPASTTVFITQTSGDETEFSSGMKRDSNKGKPRFDLMIPEGVPYKDQLLTRFAALMARGAELRGDRNWEQADSEEDLSRFRESAFRHFFQWYCGETDEDHLVGFLFNAQGAEFVKRKLSASKGS